jgi:hypothetical protein
MPEAGVSGTLMYGFGNCWRAPLGKYTFAAGYVLHRWDARRDRSGANRSRKEQDKRLN